MKKTILLVVIGFSILVSACSPKDQSQQERSEIQDRPVPESVEANRNRESNRVQEIGSSEVSQYDRSSNRSSGDISSAELEGIKFMMEEEKLARDVYQKLSGLWDMNIFSNIARSEQIHMDAVKSLIDDFDVDDPSAGAETGEFTNQELQALYDSLIDMGSQGLVEAILVGGAIEEIDILDLQAYLDDTSDSGVTVVYNNLLQGSINHLTSFVRTYERLTGEDYQPQYLSQEVYERLISQSSSGSYGQGGQGKNRTPRGNGSPW